MQNIRISPITAWIIGVAVVQLIEILSDASVKKTALRNGYSPVSVEGTKWRKIEIKLIDRI